jgi:hypothetical protein
VLAVEIVVILVLLVIFAEDMRSREVHLVWFPFLAVGLLVLRIMHHGVLADLWPSFLFLGLILVLLTIWFSLKEKRLINVTAQLLGWGDVLFLVCIALYFSLLNYLFFYLASLSLIVIGWSAWMLVSRKNDRHIPLAGMQSLLLAVYLGGDWWLFHFNAASDNWLLRFIY